MNPPRAAVTAGLAALAVLLIAAPAQASSGAFDRTWGKDVVTGGGTGFEICTVATSCQTGFVGGFGGELNSPTGVATDAAGNVYVAEFGNNRIEKFDSAGNFQRAWGKDVVTGGGTGFEICTAAASCQPGSNATAQGGEFNSPRGVAIDAAGNVYVADQNNQRIQKFDSSGNFQRAWGKDVDTAAGTGFEICIVAANCQAGSNATAQGGEFNSPYHVATDAGKVYVTDINNHRVQKFDGGLGTWERTWGKDVVTGGATGFEVCIVAANCKAGAIGTLGGELHFPTGIATDAAGNVYVADTLGNRVEKFDGLGTWARAWGKDVDTAAGTGFEICTVAASCQGGSAGGLGGEINSPRGVATDAAGNVYVADSSNHRIQKFDGSGTWARAWGKDVDTAAGTGFEICTVAANCQAGSNATALGGELNAPIGAAADAAGNVYVADTGNQRIQRFADPVPPTPPTPPTPPGGDGDGGGAGDTTAPRVSFAKVDPNKFSVGTKPTPKVLLTARAGTKIKFLLSEPASVSLRIEQALAGRLSKGRCVKPSRKLRKNKKCTRYVKKGTLRRTGVQGQNSVAFSGRIGTRALKRGRYRVVIQATDAAGNVSTAKKAKFRIVSAR
jgi:sugar lactone lactonase YvrE